MPRLSATETSQELELVRRAADGDVEAYGELYSIYLDRIYRYVFYRVGDRMVAEDITEESFVKAWKSISSCKGREHTFQAWLYRIAHNHIVDTLRARPKDISLETCEVAGTNNIEEDVETLAQRQGVLKEVSCLPEQQRQVIVLKFLEGADTEEVCRITGKRPGAIRALQMRALTTLRKRLSVEAGDNGR